MAEPKGDKPFQDFKLAESATIVESAESVESKPCTAMAVVDGSDQSKPEQAKPEQAKPEQSKLDESELEASPSAQASLWLDAENHSSSSSSVAFVAPPYKGLLRHRLIVSSCALLSLSIFALSTVNLGPLIKSAGVIDSKLKVDLTPELPKLSPDLAYSYNAVVKEGMFSVQENKWNSALEGFVDTTGKVLIAPRFNHVTGFREGLAGFSGEKQLGLVSAPVERAPAKPGINGQAPTNQYAYDIPFWGFIDRFGRVVIEPRFDSIGLFEQGVALVELDGYTLLIDKTGKTLFSTESIVRSKKIRAAGGVETEPYDLDSRETMPNGQRLTAYNVQARLSFLGELAVIATADEQKGLIDRSGKVVVQPQYDCIVANSTDGLVGYSSVDEGIAENNHRLSAFLVSKGGQWGALDPTGKELFAPKFKRILSYQNDHAAVMVGDKYGFADAKGNIVIKPEYDFVTAFDKIIAVKKGKVWSFIDSTGKPINAPAVDGVVHSGRGVWLSDGLGQVVKGNKVGFLNASGQFALPPQYDWAFAFANGYAPVFDGWFWHYIDTAGKRVTPDFASASSLENGTAPVVVPGPLFAFAQLGDIERERKDVRYWRNVVAAREPKKDEPKTDE